MATLAAVRRSKSMQALIGSTVVTLAVLGGALWQLRPSGAAARPHATTIGTAVGARPVGGMAERFQDQAQGAVPGRQTPATRAQSSADNPIIGAWMTHAVSTTAGVQANLLAFLPGGVVMHAASNFPQSAGIGAWYDAGDGTVVYTFIYRRMDKSTGAYIGSTRVHARVTVAADGLSYDSPLYTELTDPDDNVISTGQGMSHATRLVPTPPVTSADDGSPAGTTVAPAGAKLVDGAVQRQRSATQELGSSCGIDIAREHSC